MTVLTIDEMMKKGLVKKGTDPSLEIQFVPFGIPLVDDVLGKGMPRGRNMLFVGDYSSGKTFLAQQAMKAVQKQGGVAAYIDVERSYDEEWFRLSGVDTDALLVSSPEYGERAIDVAVALLEAEVDLVVLDSIIALVPTAEEQESAEKSNMGLHPKLVTKLYRRVTLSNHSSIFIGINQIRHGIGMYSPITFPGGKSQDGLSHIVLRLRRDQWIKDGDKKQGFDMSIENMKNKVSEPYKECKLPFYFNGGIDETVSNIDLALSKGIITQAGPYYKFGEHKMLGKMAMRQYLRDEPSVYEEMLVQLGELVAAPA